MIPIQLIPPKSSESFNSNRGLCVADPHPDQHALDCSDHDSAPVPIDWHHITRTPPTMASLRPIATASSSRCLFAASNTTTAAATVASSTRRTFTTTAPTLRQTPTHLTVPKEQIPDYPYGPFRTYKQRNAGLYGTSKIRFGNTISAKWQIKEPTHWKPNRHVKRLWSPSLNMFIRTRLTTGVLRTVDKLGGIDNYLLGAKARRLKELGPAGWRLRWKVMQSAPVQERWAREREAMGLPPKVHHLLVAEQGGAAPTAEVVGEMDRMLAQEEEFVLGEEVEGGNPVFEVKEVAQPNADATTTNKI
ncbi:54S ribosomal protein L24 [Apiospora arundinis]|uniref:54S ribosomal protein L24 n=1 Tax=Apiospora arundinis TaxID=335852 RepID=A0ABR2IHQ7_9PEZI